VTGATFYGVTPETFTPGNSSLLEATANSLMAAVLQRRGGPEFDAAARREIAAARIASAETAGSATRPASKLLSGRALLIMWGPPRGNAIPAGEIVSDDPEVVEAGNDVVLTAERADAFMPLGTKTIQQFRHQFGRWSAVSRA
jgi:hypothetical protein